MKSNRLQFKHYITAIINNETLLNHVPDIIDSFCYNLIENQIYCIDEYRIDLLTRTPEERYQKL